jgi:hypothetical protein
MDVSKIVWKLTPEAREDVKPDREQLGDTEYFADRDRLQAFLCAYFQDGACTTRSGSAISPVGATTGGGKILKVRWGRPGCGKRGGIRMALVAFCDRKEVVLCRVFPRRDNPTSADFSSAGALAITLE